MTTLTHNGKTYTVGDLRKVPKAFSDWIVSEQLKLLKLIKDSVGDEDGFCEKQTVALMDDIAKGEYGPGGSKWLQALTTTNGVLQVASIVLGCTTDDVVDLFVSRRDDVLALLKNVIK